MPCRSSGRKELRVLVHLVGLVSPFLFFSSMIRFIQFNPIYIHQDAVNFLRDRMGAVRVSLIFS